jgi:hypothetical protein
MALEKKDIQELIKALREAAGKEKADEKSTADLTPEEKEEERKRREAHQEYLNAQAAKYNKTLMETAQLLGNRQQMHEQEKNYLENILRNSQELKDLGVSMEDIKSNELESLGDIDENLVKQVKRYRELVKLEEARKNFGQANNQIAKSLAESIGMATNFQNSFTGAALKSLKGLTMLGDAGKANRKVFIEQFRSIFNLGNLLQTILANSIAKFNELDSARAKLAATTGAGYQFADGLESIQRRGNLMGISMGDASDAVGALATQTSKFAKMSVESQKELGFTVAGLKKLNVGAGETAKSLQFLQLNLGKTGEESAMAAKKISMMGTSIGISSEQMMRDFNASLPTLAVYGDKSIDVFTNMAAAAKAAGVEVGALLKLAGKFDTFQGSAETVGKLNALLGTQLSTTEMLMMTEDERMETLIETVQAQGVAFKDMDRFTQKAIAAAAGIDDINEAQKVFGMNVGDYRRNQEEMKRNADVQAKFDEAVQKTLPVMNQFKLLFTEITVAVTPVLETIGEYVEKFTTFFKGLSEETKTTTAMITLLGGGVIMVGAALLPFAASLASVGASLGVIGPTATGASVGIGAIGTALGGAAVGVGAMGASLTSFIPIVLSVAAGIALVTVALGGVVAAFAAYQSVKAAAMEQEARTAEAQAAEAESYRQTADALASFGNIDFSIMRESIKSVVQDLKKLGEPTDIMIKTRSTIENLALLSTGQAKDSMTGNVITTTGTNVTANVENVFSGMKMVLEIGGEKIEGVIKDIAADTATQ